MSYNHTIVMEMRVLIKKVLQYTALDTGCTSYWSA